MRLVGLIERWRFVAVECLAEFAAKRQTMQCCVEVDAISGRAVPDGTTPSANNRPSVVGIGSGTVRPSRSRSWSSPVSHARSESLRAPRRPTARCPLTRTLHTSLATPQVSGSMRATSSPHCSSTSHHTGISSPSSDHRPHARHGHEAPDASQRRRTIASTPNVPFLGVLGQESTKQSAASINQFARGTRRHHPAQSSSTAWIESIRVRTSVGLVSR